MRNWQTRRQVILGGAAALAMLTALPAQALGTAQARSLVDGLVSEVNAVIASGQSANAMYASFERIFARYADVPTIARTALGPSARSASGADLAAYTQAFQGYIARKYGARFREFIGGRITVNQARPVKSFFEVRSTANLRGEAPFDVTFLVSDRSGSPKFFDMVVEGVSLLKSEAVEIRSMLDRRGGSLPGLTADLRKAG